MKKIGQILTDNIKDAEGRVSDLIDISAPCVDFDKSLPTLIVGKKIAEAIYGKDVIKILDKKIEDNVWWTFSKMERRNEYEKDIEIFQKALYNKMEKSVEYKYFSIFESTISNLKAVLRYVKSAAPKIFYIYEKHIYVYDDRKKKVIGFSLYDSEYCGVRDDKVFELIKNNPYNIVIYNEDFLSDKAKKYVNNLNIMAPFLYFTKL